MSGAFVRVTRSSAITNLRYKPPLVVVKQGRPPARKSQGRELRADAVKVRRPRASGVGAKRRTLHGVEHSSTLTNVTAGPYAPDQNVAQIWRVKRRRNLA